MATLRSLVVSLSLQSDNFTRNIKSIQTQIRDVESEFKLAGAGVENFENTINGMGKNLNTLNEKLKLQKDITKQSKDALDSATSAFKAARSELLNYRGQLISVNVVDEESYKKKKQLAGQVEALRKQTLNAVDAMSIARKNLNAALTAEKETEAQISKLNNALDVSKTKWDSSIHNIQRYEQIIAGIGDKMNVAKSEFELASSGVDNFGESLTGLQAKSKLLAEDERLLTQEILLYEQALKEATEQRNAASMNVLGDPDKYNEAQRNVDSYTIKLNNANAALKQVRADMFKNADAIALANSGWQKAADNIADYETQIKAVQSNMVLAESKFKLATAAIDDHKRSMVELNAKIELMKTNSQELTKEIDIYEKQLSEANEQLNAAKQLYDLDKINDAKEKIKQLETTINNLKAKLAANNKELKTAESAFTQLALKLDKSAEYFDKVAERAQKLGRALTTYVTSSIVALGTASIKASIDYESAFASVRKTTEATEAEYQMLSEACITMSEQVGSSSSEIAEVMATGGQLGIAVSQLSEFTRVMIDLGNSAEDLSASDAATTLARFANIMNEAGKNSEGYYSQMGSAIVALGNNFATTEYEISEMAMRIAAAGTEVGMSSADVLGFATAFSSLGLEAQAGGTAVSKALIKMESAVKGTGDDSQEALQQFADIAGMTAEEFTQLWNSDGGAAKAFQAFINGLSNMDEEGQSTIAVLEEIGWSEVRLRDAMLRAANGSTIITDAVTMSNKAWRENNALTEEANKRYSTTETKLNNLKNKAANFAATIGDDLNPLLETLINRASRFIDSLSEMDESERKNKETTLAVIALIGPAILAYAKLNKGLGALIKTVATFSASIGKVGLAKTLASYPGLIAAAAVAAGVLTYKLLDVATGAKAAREALNDLKDIASDWESNSADTFYTQSEGLGAFGLSAEDFTYLDSVSSWIASLTTEWSDDFAESDDTINKYVESVKKMTDTTRQSLQTMSNTAAESGMTELYAQIQTDIAELDSIDAEIEVLLQKKKEYKLTDADIERLNQLLNKKQEIDVKYNITTSETGSYKQLINQVESDIAKINAMEGEDATAETKAANAAARLKVYQDALVAAAEASKQINSEIDAEYDKRREVINLIDDESEKNAELEKLNVWYNEQRLGAAQKYAAAITPYLKEVYDSTVSQDTIDKLQQLYNAVYSGDGISISEAMGQLDESQLTEIYTLITQIKDLENNGVDISSMLSGAGISYDSYTQLWSLLQGIGAGAATLDTNSYTAQVKRIFAGLADEVVKVTTELDMTAATQQWKAWAENPGASITATLTTDTTTITVGAKFGDDWQTDITELDEAGKLKLKDANGVLIQVTPEVVNALSASSLVTGVDEDGVVTVTVVPKWADKTPEEIAADTAELSKGDNVPWWRLLDSNFIEVMSSISSAYSLMTSDGPYLAFSSFVTGPLSRWEAEAAIPAEQEPLLAEYVASIIAAINNGETIDNESIRNLGVIREFIDNSLKYGKGENQVFFTTLTNLLNGAGITVSTSQLGEYIAGIIPELVVEVVPEVVKEFNKEDSIYADFFAELERYKEYQGPFLDTQLKSYASSSGLGNVIATILAAIENGETIDEEAAQLVKAYYETLLMVGADLPEGVAAALTNYDPSADAETFISNIFNALMTASDSHSPSKRMMPIGHYIAQGVAAGINAETSVFSAIKRLAQKAVNTAKEALDINSPSKVFRDEVGAMAAAGFSEGLTGGFASQSAIIRNATKQLTVSAAQSGISSAVSTNNYNYNTDSSISFAGANFNIRSQEDIKSLAQEIAALTKRNQRGKGLK